nr:PREDICTED: uncharacterized protein LOC661612 isoform X2 [Tribolium castaneum]|eukprot:XP_015838796.1 PREDICTED: uncharacterized protein LOC661612 isoform X2 [Tribolium castaneum]
MDYVRSHHLWRPLAAMSGKEQEPAVIAAPPENFSLKSTIFHNIITIASSTEESNDVWYPLDGNETSNFLLKKYDDSYFYPNYSLLNSNFSSNFSVNRTFNYYPHDETIKIVTMVGIAVLLGFIILATVIGNVFVIAAILLERNLQNVANYLILSLAVADLLVACLVMPLGAVYEVSQEWTLGPELCDMWTSSDVLCCTASILHLVAIALDSVHRPPSGLERPQVGRPDPRQRMPHQPGPLLPNLRHGFLLLPPAPRHPHPLLAHLPDRPETHPQTPGHRQRRQHLVPEPRRRGHRRRAGRRQRHRGHRRRRRHHHRPPPAHHLRDHDGLHHRLLQLQPREDLLRQRPGARHAHHHRLQHELPAPALPRQEEVARQCRLETRTESRQNSRHHHRRFRAVLAAILHNGCVASNQRELVRKIRDLDIPLAGLLQLDAEPHHLHDFQSRVSARV